MEDKIIDSDELREQNLIENAQRMYKNNKTLDTSFGLNAAVSFAYIVFSCFFIIKKISSILGANLFSYSTTENLKTPFTTSGWIFMLILSVLVVIMNARANKLHHKGSMKVLYAVYILEFIVGILGLASLWDDMEPAVGALIMAVSAVGFRYADVTNRALKELDYLSTQEGFPEFNLNLFQSQLKHEKLKQKYGEDYNKRSYNSTFFSEQKRSPKIEVADNIEHIEEITEIQPADDGTDNESSDGSMDTISDKIILSVDDDYYEDYEEMRRRPL